MFSVRKLGAAFGLGLLLTFSMGESVVGLVNHFLGANEPSALLLTVQYLGTWLIGTFIAYGILSELEKYDKGKSKIAKNHKN